MKFAGGEYIYLTKKKLEKLKKENQNENDNLSAPPILMEPPIISESKISEKLKQNLDAMEVDKKSNNSNSCCSFSGDHLDDRYSGSFEDNLSSEEPMNVEKPKKHNDENKQFSQETDINILSIEYESILDKDFSLKENPIRCKSCHAVVNMFSNLNLIENDKYKWECEFCSQMNEITINKDSIPLNKNMDYIIQEPKIKEETPKIGEKAINENDDTSLIFCFDISGSMSQSYTVSKEIYDKIAGTKNKHKKKNFMNPQNMNMNMNMMNNLNYNFNMNQNMYDYSSDEDQYDFNYNYQKFSNSVTRLETLQTAISSNIKKITKESPNKKVGLVTFNSKVTVYGDCTSNKLILDKNNMNDEKTIIELGEKNASIISNPISKSSNKILTKLNNVDENGTTALGPAILLSLSLLKNAKKGSRIFLCTDGLANEGIGKLEGEENLEKEKEFYEKIGNDAKEKGYSISLITFKDQHSGIEILMKMVEKSGGDVIRVTPEEICDDFSDLLENNIIGNNATLEIILPKMLMFRNEKNEYLSNYDSNYKRTIGNIKSDMIDYFEFKFKKSKILSDMKVDLKEFGKIPIQAMIEYSDNNNGKYVKVFTELKTISSNKEKILEKADFDIVSGNAMQKSAKIAMEGRLRDAQKNTMAWKKFLSSNQNMNQRSTESYNLFKANMNNFNQNLVSAQCSNLNNRVSDRLANQMLNFSNNNQFGSRTMQMIERKKKNKKK